ncbi:hypothetical protein CHS0354_020678, partial [Potamilus streckersoni]
MDIRNFFKGISLPSGCIHIFGGDTGDAFITFISDEDARKVMMLNKGYIGDGQIFLSISSPAEMLRRIEEVKLHSDFGFALQFINQYFRSLGSKTFSVNNPEDRKSYPPLRRELFKSSTPPDQDHLFSNRYEIPCGRIDRGNLIHGPQRIRRIDERMDVHSQNRSDISALGWSCTSTQQTDIQLHAAGPDVPQFRRMDGPHPNRKVCPPSGPEAFENSKAPFPDECVIGPGRKPWMGMGFRERLPNMWLPRSRPPSLMNSFGASERFPSPDIRPTLDKGNYFGRPVGPQPFGPTEARGTKRPHPDESG